MDHFEMVEKLRAKANVSYEEAKAALEACDWDLLDALVFLEGEGKLDKKGGEPFTTQETKKEAKQDDAHKGFTGGMNRVGGVMADLIKKGGANSFVVTRNKKEVLSLPLIAFVLLLIFMFWWMVGLLLLGLLTGFRYTLRGPQVDENQKVQQAMDKVSQAAESFTEKVNEKVSEKANEHKDDDHQDNA